MFYNISVKDALNMAVSGKAVLFDMRTKEDYQKGHLPMAIHVTEEELEEEVKKYEGKQVILYCTYGNASLKMARDFSEQGLDVYSIVGGYQAYNGYIEMKKDDMWTMEWKNS